MATIRTTAKTNPITGDPKANPLPAYARGRQTNFAGADRKRTPDSEGLYNAGERTAKMRFNQELVKKVDDSFKADQKRYKDEEKSKKREQKSNWKSGKKDERSLKRAVNQARGNGPLRKLDMWLGDVLNVPERRNRRNAGKKNMDTGGDKSKLCVDKSGQKTQDADCKIKMSNKQKREFKKQKPVKNTQWTISK